MMISKGGDFAVELEEKQAEFFLSARWRPIPAGGRRPPFLHPCGGRFGIGPERVIAPHPKAPEAADLAAIRRIGENPVF